MERLTGEEADRKLKELEGVGLLLQVVPACCSMVL